MSQENFNPTNPEPTEGSSRIPLKFNFSNEQSLIYEHEFLKITVLGGIKLEGLDRMRVTLKVELKETSVPPVRHNLDLYNDTQTEKLIRKAAERLEIGTSLLLASVVELTEQLEEYRLERIKETQPQPYESPKLTKEEQKQAEQFLSESNLLERTNELVGQSGVIGEVDNRLLMYLIFTSRKREAPLHIVSLAASGTGKTHLQESVANLIPEEDRIELTTLSENAFYYFGQRELKNKLILIEDLDGLSSRASGGGGSGSGALYALRELQSKRRITKTIAQKSTNGQTKSITLTVEGPVSVAGCTTKEQIYEDNANRSFLLYLDESAEQDDRIMNYQRAQSAGTIDESEQEQAAELLRNAQRLLEPIKVVNPYAQHLKLPKAVFKPRRTNNHYLQFIEAVTFYYQKQREQKVDKATGEVYIETTLEDIEAANKLLGDVLLRKSDDLTGACRNYFEKLKLYLIGEDQKTFTNRRLSLQLRIPITTIKRYHHDLYNCGYLRIAKKDKLRGYEYEIISYEEYKQLQSGITQVLDDSLEQLKNQELTPEALEGGRSQTTGPVAAQSKSGPAKQQKTKKKASTAQ